MHLALAPQGFPEMAGNFLAASFRLSLLKDMAAKMITLAPECLARGHLQRCFENTATEPFSLSSWLSGY